MTHLSAKWGSPGEIGLCLGSLGLFGWACVGTSGTGLALALAGAGLLLALVSRWIGSGAAQRCTDLFAFLLGANVAATCGGVPWPINSALAILLFGLLDRQLRPPALEAERAVPPIAAGDPGEPTPPRLPDWLPWGQFRPGLIATLIPISALGLLGWLILTQPDLSEKVRLIPALPLPILVLLGVIFSVGNALLEELIFRGAMMRALEAVFADFKIPIILQALAFGLAHWNGIPSGIVGAMLAAFYGLLVGALRRSSGGLLSPFIAHIGADATIAVLLFLQVRSTN